MKKIVFINSRLSNGGSERVMTLLANALSSKEEYEVKMILTRDKEEEIYKTAPNIETIQFKYRYKFKFLRALERIQKLKKFFKEYNPDIIVSFMVDLNIYTLISGKKFWNRIIVSERADPNQRNNKIYKFFEKKLYPKAKCVVLQTPDVKEYFNKINVFNTKIIPNPVNNALKPYYGEREKRIVAAGRITKQKNFKLLITAFSKIISEINSYCLEIYGEGPLKDELRKLACELNIENNVKFPGYIKNVNEKMKNASLYVSTSDYEGISNSMIEALALGIPTICTDCPVGGARMMIEDGINGVLIPVGDEEELVKAMKKVLTDAEFSYKISQNAIGVNEKYSIENIILQWEEIFIQK